MREESKFFYDMLLITYTSKKQQQDQLKNHFKLMLENNEVEMWDTFEKKIDMLIEELYCFMEIVSDFDGIQALYEKNKEKREILKQKLTDLINSDVEMVGFFTRKTKAEKIQEYRTSLKDADELDEAYRRVLNLVSAIIVHHEIETIKNRKKVRYDDALKTFSQRKVKSLEDSLQFWNCLHDDFQGDSLLQSRFSNMQL